MVNFSINCDGVIVGLLVFISWMKAASSFIHPVGSTKRPYPSSAKIFFEKTNTFLWDRRHVSVPSIGFISSSVVVDNEVGGDSGDDDDDNTVNTNNNYSEQQLPLKLRQLQQQQQQQQLQLPDESIQTTMLQLPVITTEQSTKSNGAYETPSKGDRYETTKNSDHNREADISPMVLIDKSITNGMGEEKENILDGSLLWKGVVVLLCAVWASNFACAKIVLAQPGVDASLYALARFSLAALSLLPGTINAARKGLISWETARGAFVCGSWVTFGYLGSRVDDDNS